MNKGLRKTRRSLFYVMFGAVALLTSCSGKGLPGGNGLPSANELPGGQLVPSNQSLTTVSEVAAAAEVTQQVELGVTATLPAVMVSSNESTLSPTAAPQPQLPTAIATITPVAPLETPSPTPSLEPSITPTPTDPPPTFTPPPPPPESPGEHLIFGRPVPSSATQWTDKAYPYGSTRGGTLQPHHGVEFDVPTGTPVLAAAAGTVRVAGPDDLFAVGPQTNFYGNVVVVEHNTSPHGLPVFTLYGHLSQVDVVVGQQVAAQEQLGLSGDTGIAYGPHLHFEVREGTNTYLSTRNPVLWLRPFSEDGIVAALVTFANGQPANEVPVTLRRVDGFAPYTASTSYALAPVNGDLTFGENFAVDDVLAGYYEIIAGDGRNATKQVLWVYPGRTNLVTIALP